MDNIRVAIRIRPLNQRETLNTQQQQPSPWIFENNSITQLSASTNKQVPINRFTFGTVVVVQLALFNTLTDHIYTSDANTLSLYDEVAKGIVNSVMEGMNGIVFINCAHS